MTYEIIDCTTPALIHKGNYGPSCYGGRSGNGCKSVIKHVTKAGRISWNVEAQEEALYLSGHQQSRNKILGIKLYKELKAKSIPVLNANVLDYLLAKPYLIPKSWEGKVVYFWGTIYQDFYDRPIVRCMQRWTSSSEWESHLQSLDTFWGREYHAATHAG